VFTELKHDLFVNFITINNSFLLNEFSFFHYLPSFYSWNSLHILQLSVIQSFFLPSGSLASHDSHLFLFVSSKLFFNYRFHFVWNQITESLRELPSSNDPFILSNHHQHDYYCQNQFLIMNSAAFSMLSSSTANDEGTFLFSWLEKINIEKHKKSLFEKNDLSKMLSLGLVSHLLAFSELKNISVFTFNEAFCLSSHVMVDLGSIDTIDDASQSLLLKLQQEKKLFPVFYLDYFQDATLDISNQDRASRSLDYWTIMSLSLSFFSSHDSHLSVNTQLFVKIENQPNVQCRLNFNNHSLFFTSFNENIFQNRLFCDELSNSQYLLLMLHQYGVEVEESSLTSDRRSTSVDSSPLTLGDEKRPASLNLEMKDENTENQGFVYFYNWTHLSLDEGYNVNDVYGYGNLLIENDYFYSTHMHSLYTIFMKRFQLFSSSSSSCSSSSVSSSVITRDREKARFFVIPYDVVADIPDGGDATRYLPACPKSSFVMEELNQTEEWQLSEGRNHVLIISTLISNIITHKKCGYFVFTFCKYCIKITIEDLYSAPLFVTTSTADRLNSYLNRQLVASFEERRDVNKLLTDSQRIIAIPYPSSYHFPSNWNHLDYFAYQQQLPRNIVSVFIGSDLLQDKVMNSSRLLLRESCSQVGFPSCLWVNILSPNDSFPSQVSPVIFSEKSLYVKYYYSKSVFCLMPKGSTFSRKAFIDAILSGCIPIVFHLKSCYFLYSLHLPYEIASNICYYYPLTSFMKRPVLFFQWLEMLKESPEIIVKQTLIAKVSQQLQYSLIDMSQSLKNDSVDSFDILFLNLRTVS
jgi:hypothetical protein